MQARRIWSRYLGLLIFLGAACSKVEVRTPRSNVSEKKFVVDAQSAKPTKIFKKNAPFLDLAPATGLEDYRASQLALIDFNNDGWTDISVLEGSYSRPKFLIYHPNLNQFLPTMEDPFPDNFIGASHVLYFDYNKDGIIDALSGAFILGNKNLEQLGLNLYKGSMEKGVLRFSEQPFPELKFAPSTVTLFDYNLDGYIDLFVGDFGREVSGSFIPGVDFILQGDGQKFKPILLLEGEKRVKFDTELGQLNAVPTWNSYSCDVNHDGLPDILVAAASGYPNRLWINNGKSFFDYGGRTNFSADFTGMHKISGGGRSISAMCGDVNQDGLTDTILGEMNYSYDNDELDRSSLLLQEKLAEAPYFRFNRIEFSRGEQTTSSAIKRVAMGDLNLDGDEEMILEDNGFPPFTRLRVFLTDAQKDIASDLGIDVMNPQSIVMGDLNGDFKPDLVMGQSLERNPTLKSEIHYFKNNQSTSSTLYKIKFRAQKSNFEAQGVRLIAYFVDGTKTRKYYKSLSFIYGEIQHENALYLAAKGNEKLKKLEVFWPHVSHKNKAINYSVKGDGARVFLEVFENGKLKSHKLPKVLD